MRIDIPLPPVLTVTTLLVQELLARPARPSAWRLGVAAGAAGCCAGLFVVSAIIFRQAGTTIEPMHPEATTVLIDEGPFSFSRNPIYLAMMALTLANALRLGRFRVLVPSAALFGWFNQVQIPREERAIRGIFGRDFDDYTARVRRWL